MDETALREQRKRDDHDIFTAVHNDLSGAWQRFEHRFRPVVTRVISHALSPGRSKFTHEDVEDSVQVAMLKLAKPNVLNGVETPEGFVVNIAKKTAIDRMRKHNELEVSIDDPDVADKLDLRNDHSLNDPERAAEKAVLNEAVRATLGCLTGQERRALTLRVFESMQTNEVATTMNISERRVNQLISKAYCRLAEPISAVMHEWNQDELKEVEDE
jgi:RNA polymerase sigma factor (sigma-70 family)